MPAASRPDEAETADFRHSYAKDRAQLLRRLSRLEGQVRGIARMIERDEYCIDILQQTAALRAAVDAVSLLVMEDHVAGCLRHAVGPAMPMPTRRRSWTSSGDRWAVPSGRRVRPPTDRRIHSGPVDRP